MRAILWLMIGLALGFGVALGNAEELSFDGPNAFRLPDQRLNTAELAQFNYGRSLFHYEWDPLPAASGGQRSLGPLFNANSCAGCHVRDGRGLPPGAADGLGGLVLLIVDADGPFGVQVQDRAVAPLVPELSVEAIWEPAAVPGDPEAANILRRPSFRFIVPAEPGQSVSIDVSARLAPPMIGLGLLGEIPQEHLLASADPADQNEDGISGRVNLVRTAETGEPAVGRFGWKASVASVAEQVGKAATLDIGLTTPGLGHPAGDCTAQQMQCLAQAAEILTPADYDLDANSFRLLSFYAANLAVPPRRFSDIDLVTRGEKVFRDIGCTSCHTPSHIIRDGETIAPYTDLLLHDMGEGLADGLAVGTAHANEWRTPPLWGLGRTGEVSGAEFYLHDGRARGLLEAILWHGGEAAAAQSRFRFLTDAARADLIGFLRSL